MDDVAPSAPSTPREALLAGSTLGTKTLPITVSWTAATDPQSGVQRYVATDEYDRVVTKGTSITRSHPWASYGSARDVADDWQIQAYDDAGNGSALSPISDTLSPIVFQQTLAYTTYSAGWSSSSSSSYSGGSAKYSTRAGASATFRAWGRSFAWVTYKASNRGKAKVYVDGVYKGTITLRSSTIKVRNLAYAVNFSAYGTHTIKIVVASGRVDVDAFVVFRRP
jgi:hypothetical protein